MDCRYLTSKTLYFVLQKKEDLVLQWSKTNNACKNIITKNGSISFKFILSYIG